MEEEEPIEEPICDPAETKIDKLLQLQNMLQEKMRVFSSEPTEKQQSPSSIEESSESSVPEERDDVTKAQLNQQISVMNSIRSHEPEIVIDTASNNEDEQHTEQLDLDSKLEIKKILTKKNSVEIACPLTSIMEDDEEYEAKTPFDPVILMHAKSTPQPLTKTN